MNREEPFQDEDQNIIYDFKPPNKQFDNDINSRSGGEKTIAGLALVFSLAMEKSPQPPMILLDEVDAHLDQQNIDLLVKYIRNWENKPQVLMISHHERAVQNCDSLIGVTQQEYLKMPDDQQDLAKNTYVSAVTFSLDLA